MDINSFVIGYKKGKASTPIAPAVETQEKEITVKENGTTEVLPDDGKLLSKVTVNTEVASGGGGGGSGGGVELNIAYGDTPPEDTSKLWVKTSEPSGVIVSPNIDISYEEDISFEILEPTFVKAKQSCPTVEVGGKIYIFGGTHDGYGTYGNEVHCFDPNSETLTKISESNRVNSGITAIESNIYIFAGGVFTGVAKFDTLANTFTTLSATFSVKRNGNRAVAVGKKIYVFGGGCATINCFDTDTEELTTLSTALPTDLSFFGCAKVGNKIYLLGGTPSVYTTYFDSCYCFDIETETITTLPSLPKAIAYSGCVSIGTQIYLVGGTNNEQNVIRFDTDNETYETLPITLPHALIKMGCASVGMNIYTFGGAKSTSPKNDVKTIGKLSLQKENVVVENGLLHIVPQLNNNIFSLINTNTARVEIGVNKAYKGNENNTGEKIEASVYKDGAWTNI